MDRVCVYCGSNPGRNPAYVEAAESFGRELVDRDLGLVFGGGGVGMMGAIAESAFEAGGEVIGVIPETLERRERPSAEVTELHVVDSMHARKRKMVELADGFAALPGGLGTLEEIFEVLTWAQLGIHRDPCGFLNADGYYSNVVGFLNLATDEGFVDETHRSMVHVADDPATLLDEFDSYEPPPVRRWLDEDDT